MKRNVLMIAPALFLTLMTACAAAPDETEQAFLAQNALAMNKMMADMDAPPTGDVDQDFVAMMVPHHQGAIEMAQAVLRYGHNEQLRRIAQEIIVDQQQEIAAMRLALGQPLPASYAAPTAVGTAAPSPATPAIPVKPASPATSAHHHMPM
jgi:predicted outer membrane protein